MAISTYDEIVKQVVSWSNRQDLEEYVGGFIYLAGNSVNQILRVPAMETTEILTVTEGGKIMIPQNYLELKSMTAMWNSDFGVPLERLAWDQFINYRNSPEPKGQPRYFSRQGPYLFLTPEPPVGSQVTMHFYGAMPDINEVEQTNWLTGLSPQAYMFGALHYLYLFILDEARADFWNEKFKAEVARIQELSDAADHKGSALTVRPRNPRRAY